MNYWGRLTNLVLLPLLILWVLLVALDNYQQQITSLIPQANWFAFGALTFALVFALQFSRSRIFYANLLLAGLLAGHLYTNSFPDILFLIEFVSLVILAYLSINTWQRDRGFRIQSILQLSLLLLLLSGVAYGLIVWEQSSPNTELTTFALQLYNLSPILLAQFSPVQLVLVLSALIIAFTGLLRTPSKDNMLLIFLVSLVVVAPLVANNNIRALASLLFATVCILIILRDSHTMAFKDELTEIPARRALFQFVSTLGPKYSVVMADVDHFKSFNDTYGHDVGDQVLKMVAQKLNKVSAGGKAFRYGGEEFTLVFPAKTPEQIESVVNNLRESIADYKMAIRNDDRPDKKPSKKSKKGQSENKTVQVTMSFGVALKNKEVNFERALKMADEALYKAKKSGRNRVELAAS